MPCLSIDQREIDVSPGTTLLEAAAALGIEVPSLCHLEGYRPSTSCLVCMVKVCGTGGGRLVPACATLAEEGMVVESETEAVHHVRRTALELLLSDHLGDCLAPCQFACPAHMDVPNMLRQIGRQEDHEAIVTIKRDIAFPAVLGRICPKPCEKGCRRQGADGAVAVCQLKRFAADADLASAQPYVPFCAAPSAKRVAIIGAGITGLSAAYYLTQLGHACTVFEAQALPGGRLRHEYSPAELPPEVLDAEVTALLRVGIELRCAQAIDDAARFSEVRGSYDAVLIACGGEARDYAFAWEVAAGARGIQVNKETYQTSVAGVFAAGNAIRTKGLAVRSAADGKEAAVAIDQYLRAAPVTGVVRPFSTRLGRLEPEEVRQFTTCSNPAPRTDVPPDESAPDRAAGQAQRCLHCDCRGRDVCKLRRYAQQYGADPNRYAGQRARFEQHLQPSGVLYEPGKCINCGLCIQIVEEAGEPLGLSFVGRGFDVRIGVPFDRSLDEALGRVAAKCVAACPTAALSFHEKQSKLLPILGQ